MARRTIGGRPQDRPKGGGGGDYSLFYGWPAHPKHYVGVFPFEDPDATIWGYQELFDPRQPVGWQARPVDDDYEFDKGAEEMIAKADKNQMVPRLSQKFVVPFFIERDNQGKNDINRLVAIKFGVKAKDMIYERHELYDTLLGQEAIVWKEGKGMTTTHHIQWDRRIVEGKVEHFDPAIILDTLKLQDGNAPSGGSTDEMLQDWLIDRVVAEADRLDPSKAPKPSDDGSEADVHEKPMYTANELEKMKPKELHAIAKEMGVKFPKTSTEEFKADIPNIIKRIIAAS